MKVLLDTHAFLWWINDDPRLTRRARRIMANNASEVFFSAASGWEITIKARLGRLSLATADLESFLAEQLASNGFKVLPVNLQHALRTYRLPDHHQDPFDRLLVAQAAVENLPLLSADRRLTGYPIRILW